LPGADPIEQRHFEPRADRHRQRRRHRRGLRRGQCPTHRRRERVFPMSRRTGRLRGLFLLLLLHPVAARAVPSSCTGPLPTFLDGVFPSSSCSGPLSPPACPSGCGGTSPSTLQNCQPPKIGAPTFSLNQQGDGTYTARWTLDIVAPWNNWGASNNPSGTLEV